MNLSASSYFRRRVKKLAPAERAALQKALERFQANPADPSLHLHKLSGHLSGRWAFSAGYDLRVVCRIRDDIAELLTVGTHNEVY